MKKILWLGSYITENCIDELNSMGFNKASTYISQKNILEGLEQNTGFAFDSIGAVVLPDYPKCRTFIFRRKEMFHSATSKNILVRYLNLKYINKLSTNLSLVHEAKKWAKMNQGNQVDIFIYEMRSGCMKAACSVKKIIPNARIHLIVPDLPMFMDLSMNRFKTFLKTMDQNSMLRLFPSIDTYILYASGMAEYLGIQHKKWMLMEGSVHADEIPPYADNDTTTEANNRFTVMYSGHIDRKFGIFELVDAYKHLDNTYALWITGSGPDAAAVAAAVKDDARITYYGYLPSRRDLLELQKKADAFINIRHPEEAASGYCFPSKMFEFLLSGKPVLSCRLKGIPDEYFHYLVEIKSLDSFDIAEAIQRTAILEPQARKALGRSGRSFIAEKKNNIYQTNRILRFINGSSYDKENN